jgi:hypothetical protein
MVLACCCGLFVYLVSLSRRIVLMPVPAPAGGLLSFASPKESRQRKGDPDAAYFLRAEAFGEGRQKGLPSPSADVRHPCRTPSGNSR